MWYPGWAPKPERPGAPSADRSAESRAFEPVVTAIEQVVPRVEVGEPGLAYVRVEGAVRYYGGERPLTEAVLATIPSGARMGLADGPFAARCAAEQAGESECLIVEDTAHFLAGLDIDTLGAAELSQTFRWLGVATLGDLARLPREAVASRFGSLGLGAHRLAAGEDRLLHPRPIPPGHEVESLHHDDPLTTADQVAFVSRALAVRMMNGLEGVAPFRVLVEVEAGDGTVRQRVWRSLDPFTDHSLAERVWWQLQAWMATPGGVPDGVTRIRLDPSDLSDEGRQLALLEQVGTDGDSWQEVDTGRHDAERALSRAQALVGPDAVLQAESRGGRMPHEQIVWYPWGDRPPESAEEAPWPGSLPAPTPALISPRPPQLEVEWDGGMPVRVRLGTRWEPVLTWTGPWRMLGRWWKGEAPADRYQIVTSAGAVLCLVREGKAYLAGVYD